MRKSALRRRQAWRVARLAGCLILILGLGTAASPSLSRASVTADAGPVPPGPALFDVGVHSSISPAQAAASTSPTFTKFQATVKVGATSYTYVMAGKNPAMKVTNAAATIKAKLVPVIIKSTNGDTWDPTTTDSCDSSASALSRVQKSPIVTSQAWTWGGTFIGSGQLTDAFQRAEFWTYAQPGGINPSYGVNLAWTTLKPVTITVPSGNDQQAHATCGNGLVEEISISWLDKYLQTTVIPSLASQGVSPSTVPVFLLHNVVELTGMTPPCCDLGYHKSYKTASGSQTYALADYDNSGDFPGSTDINTLSHEVGEWQDDPYGTNPVPAWGPIGQAASCQGNLEVGDPLSDQPPFTVTVGGFTYHPQELAFFSWFFHQSPGLGVNGWYSDQGRFGTFAPGCWTAATVPLPAGGAAANPEVFLHSVACPSASACVAVGSYMDPSNNIQGLIVTGSGNSWTATEAPLPANAAATPPGAELYSVACSSATSCTAVGYYTDSSGSTQGLLVTGSGTSWTATEAPLPANSTNGQLYSVACPSTSACTAAGNAISSGVGEDFLVTGSGTTWTATKAPLPANAAANPELNDFRDFVACSSASSCTDVSAYTDSSGGVQGLLITGSGTTWTATEAPLPANAAADPSTNATLDAVACPPASACVAVGSYEDTSVHQDDVLVTGSGTSWTATEAPLPANATASQNQAMYDVACSSGTSCTAVGLYSAGLPQGLLVSGSGTSWQAAEAPGNNGYAALNSVACPSTSACVAAGNYGNSPPNNNEPILVTGSGTHWIGVHVPLPPGANPGIELQGSACAAAFSCVAVGFYGYPGPIEGLLLTQTS